MPAMMTLISKLLNAQTRVSASLNLVYPRSALALSCNGKEGFQLLANLAANEAPSRPMNIPSS